MEAGLIMSDYMTVFCDNRSSKKHGKKHPTPAVQEFVYADHRKDDLGMGWTDNNARRKRLIQEGAHVNVARALVGNERYSQETHRGQQRRESYSFECPKCGESADIRHEKMYPAFSKLRELGIDRVSLATLRDIAARGNADWNVSP